MKRFVLDASVALAWFIDNPISDSAVRVRTALLAGSHAVVPQIWHLEMANGLAVAERRRILLASDVDLCLTTLEKLLTDGIETLDASLSLRRVLLTARTLQLSAYDAAYLETAREAGLPLATLDRTLAAAASAANVSLLN